MANIDLSVNVNSKKKKKHKTCERQRRLIKKVIRFGNWSTSQNQTHYMCS